MANTGLTAYQQASLQMQQQRLAMQQQAAELAQRQKEAQSQSMTPYQQAQVALAQQRQMSGSSTNPILEALNQATALQYTPAESPIYSTGVQMLQQVPQWNGRSETPLRDYLLQALTLKGVGSLMQGFGEDRISQELRPQYTQVLQALDPTSQYLPDIQADSFDPKTFQWKLVDALQNNERQKKLQDTLANALAQRGATTGDFGLTMGEDGILSIVANPEIAIDDESTDPYVRDYQKILKITGDPSLARQIIAQRSGADQRAISDTVATAAGEQIASMEKMESMSDQLRAIPGGWIDWQAAKLGIGPGADVYQILQGLSRAYAKANERGALGEKDAKVWAGVTQGSGIYSHEDIAGLLDKLHDYEKSARIADYTQRAKFYGLDTARAKSMLVQVEALKALPNRTSENVGQAEAQSPVQGSSSQQIPPGYKLQRNKKTGETRLVPQ